MRFIFIIKDSEASTKGAGKAGQSGLNRGKAGCLGGLSKFRSLLDTGITIRLHASYRERMCDPRVRIAVSLRHTS